MPQTKSILKTARHSTGPAYFDKKGHVSPALVAETLHLSKGQLAQTIGLSPEALYKVERTKSLRTQERLRDMLDIVNRVVPWAGGMIQAFAWYRAQPLPAFGDRTAEALVKDGKAVALREYLDHLAMGGFA